MAKKRRRRLEFPKTTIIALGGLLGVAFEAKYKENPRPELLVTYLVMMGSLPAELLDILRKWVLDTWLVEAEEDDDEDVPKPQEAPP